MLKWIVKFFLFCVVLALVTGTLRAWVNIWVPKHSVGLLSIRSETEDASPPLVVRRKGFDWHWQRALPGWTELHSFSITQKRYTLSASVPLPNAALYGAISERVSPHDFIVSFSLEFVYSLDVEKLEAYITENKIRSAYVVESLILDNLKNMARIAMRDDLTRVAPSAKDVATMRNALNTALNTSLKNARSTLPVIVQSTDVVIVNTPNIGLYARLHSTLAEGSLPEKEIQPAPKDIRKLEFYLYFMQELGKIVTKTPEISKLVEMLPPSKVLSDEDNSRE